MMTTMETTSYENWIRDPRIDEYQVFVAYIILANAKERWIRKDLVFGFVFVLLCCVCLYIYAQFAFEIDFNIYVLRFQIFNTIEIGIKVHQVFSICGIYMERIDPNAMLKVVEDRKRQREKEGENKNRTNLTHH